MDNDEKNDIPEPKDPVPEDKQTLSRRDFITTSALSAATIAVSGVGSAIVPGTASAADSRGKKIASPRVSPKLERILSDGLNDRKFRELLIKDPATALKSRGIRASGQELETIERVLTNPSASKQFLRDGRRAGCPYNMECGYRGY